MDPYRSTVKTMLLLSNQPEPPPQSMFSRILQVLEDIGFSQSTLPPNPTLQEPLAAIREAYRDPNQRTMMSTSVDYSLPEFQAAYMYKYGTSHLNMICKELKLFQHLVPAKTFNEIYSKAQFGNELDAELRVCCIGGGPAIDAVALQMFLHENLGFAGRFAVNVLDKCPSWETTAKQLVNRFGQMATKCKITNLEYEYFDFFENNPMDYSSLGNADIISISKFLSVVCQDEAKCKTKLMEIFNALKTGALVLFCENSGGGYDSIFNSVASEAGLTMLSQSPKHDCRVCKTEKKTMSPLVGDVRHQPQKVVSIVSSLWIKQSTELDFSPAAA